LVYLTLQDILTVKFHCLHCKFICYTLLFYFYNFYGKRERTDTEDEDEEVPPQAKGYDGAKRIKCDCGSEIRKSDMARHRGTLKHQDYTEKM